MNDVLVKFIVMRAFRTGEAKAGDLLRASDVSKPTATRIMQQALECYADLVYREKSKMKPIPHVSPPDFASEAALLNALDKGCHQPLDTGLFGHELPVVYVSWSDSHPPKEGVLNLITTAIRCEKVLEIVYLKMTLGARPERKLIYPLALEKMNDQWRVLAQDLQQEDTPLRVYVLSRILDAVPAARRRPNGMIRRGHHDVLTTLPVALDPRLSPLQKKVLSRELRVHDGEVRIASRSRFEFCRRFADLPASAGAIWPPLRLNAQNK